MPAGNVTLTANATISKNSYTVTYYANNGSGNTKSYTVQHGNSHTVQGSSLFSAPSGYTFESWGSYKPEETIIVTGNISLIAKWYCPGNATCGNVKEISCGPITFSEATYAGRTSQCQAQINSSGDKCGWEMNFCYNLSCSSCGFIGQYGPMCPKHHAEPTITSHTRYYCETHDYESSSSSTSHTINCIHGNSSEHYY